MVVVVVDGGGAVVDVVVVGAAVVVDAAVTVVVDAGAPVCESPPDPHPAPAQRSARGTTIHRSRRYTTTTIMVL
jgi:hypothetical protein